MRVRRAGRLPTGIAFRGFRKSDLEPCLRLVRRALGRKHEAVCREDLTLLPYGDLPFYPKRVLTEKGKVVALVCLYWHTYYPRNIAGIDWLVVAPSHQRSGFGTWLVKWSIAEAKASGRDTLFTWAAGRSRPFYAKLGFRRSRIIPREEDPHAVLMARKI